MKNILALAPLLISFAMAEDAKVIGYDDTSEHVLWQYILMGIGYLVIAIFLAYTIIRLFVEEFFRYKEYKAELEVAVGNAKEYDIDIDALFHPRKVVKDEE